MLAVPLSRIAWAEEPVVLRVTAPANALPVLLRVMVLLFVSVVKEDVPVTVTAKLWVMSPALAVMLKLPPTVTVPRSVIPDA